MDTLIRPHGSRGAVLFVLSVFCLIIATVSSSGAAEPSSNNTCATATDLGTPTLPHQIEGSLDPESSIPDVTGDIDFYKIDMDAARGTALRVDLLGAAKGHGTLADPLLGYYDSACNLISYNDDYIDLDSRLIVTVPSDGVVIIATTSYADFEFAGAHAGAGSYQLALTPFLTIGSIQGQLVDATTGSPLPGDVHPFGSVTLLRCESPADPATCTNVVGVNAGTDGRFSIATDSAGAPLETGTYRLASQATGYQTVDSEPFTVSEAQVYELGEIALTLNPTVGSIQGQIIDARTRVGLSGPDYPNVYVWLNRCDAGSCITLKSDYADGNGRFRFENDYPGHLAAGEYEIVVTAEDFQEGRRSIGTVSEGRHRDIGKFRLEPNPILISDVRPCENVPADGGICRYRISVTNRSLQPIKGAAWSTVGSNSTGSLFGYTDFQTASPTRRYLKPGEKAVLNFHFHLPSTIPLGAEICSFGWFGRNPYQPFFNTLAAKGLFCLTKLGDATSGISVAKGSTGYSLLPKKAAAKIFRERMHSGSKPGSAETELR